MTGGVVRRDGLRETYRVGRKVGRTIYRQRGPEPSDDDQLIGVMDTEWLAEQFVEAANARVLDAVPDVPPTEAREIVQADWDPALRAIQGSSLLGVADTGDDDYRDLYIDDDDDLPVAPPDPPAVDVDAIARVLVEHFWSATDDETCTCGWKSSNWDDLRLRWEMTNCEEGDDTPQIDRATREFTQHQADALTASGVLVAAADVRARAWDEGERAGHTNANPYRHLIRNPYRDRAVSEREGTT